MRSLPFYQLTNEKKAEKQPFWRKRNKNGTMQNKSALRKNQLYFLRAARKEKTRTGRWPDPGSPDCNSAGCSVGG
jgi:hypothetical protein